MELISRDIIRKQDAINSLFPLKSKYVLEPIKDAVVTECIKEIDKIQAVDSRPISEQTQRTNGFGIDKEWLREVVKEAVKEVMRGEE